MQVEKIGLTYHSHENGPYWDESACYQLSAAEIDILEAAGEVLHHLCLEAAEAVIHNNWFSRLGLPDDAIPIIVRSWEQREPSLYGRFDLSYDGSSPPQLLEYNADTPTALLEAAVAQWFWLQDCRPGADQFNSIHEKLIAAWRRWTGRTVHFTGVPDHPEDEMTLLYLRDCAEQAGVKARHIFIHDIGWDPREQCFVDLDLQRIDVCFKLYPWEWLCAEKFGAHLTHASPNFIEPAWKMLLSNKGLLPVLWELFPGHPNLLPAYEQADPLGGTYVRKPKLSREGSNVLWVQAGTVLEETGGLYGDAGFIYQRPAVIPDFAGHRPVFGVWMIGNEPAGLGIREDTRRITGNLSRFVPHFFT
jgi:glutathionylspermidine synthase